MALVRSQQKETSWRKDKSGCPHLLLYEDFREAETLLGSIGSSSER